MVAEVAAWSSRTTSTPELHRADWVLSVAFQQARAASYRPGSPQMTALLMAERYYTAASAYPDRR